jgi:hypothetical protein
MIRDTVPGKRRLDDVDKNVVAFYAYRKRGHADDRGEC